MTPQELSQAIQANATTDQDLFGAYQALLLAKLLPLFKNDKPVSETNPVYSSADPSVRTPSFAEWKELQSVEAQQEPTLAPVTAPEDAAEPEAEA